MNANLFIKGWESLSLSAYRDGKGWAIGWGCQIRDATLLRALADYADGSDNKYCESVTVSASFAEALFRTRVEEARITLQRFLGPEVFDEIAQGESPRYAAFLSMAYQMGPRLNSFGDMRSAVAMGNWAMAAREALDSHWAREETPLRAEACAWMIETNQWWRLPLDGERNQSGGVGR